MMDISHLWIWQLSNQHPGKRTPYKMYIVPVDLPHLLEHPFFAYPDKLSDLIGLGLSNHEDLSSQRLNACKQFLGEVDGKASQRVVNAIIESGIPIGHRG